MGVRNQTPRLGGQPGQRWPLQMPSQCLMQHLECLTWQSAQPISLNKNWLLQRRLLYVYQHECLAHQLPPLSFQDLWASAERSKPSGWKATESRLSIQHYANKACEEHLEKEKWLHIQWNYTCMWFQIQVFKKASGIRGIMNKKNINNKNLLLLEPKGTLAILIILNFSSTIIMYK